MSAIIFDTETTGLDAPEVIEAAWLEIDIDAKPLDVGYMSRHKPSKPISLGAMATHHIRDEDLADCEPSSSFRLPNGVEYLIGHNVDFDWAAIGKPQVNRIDVCAMCRALWPEADSHSQGAMLYLLMRKNAREMLREAHNALTDVFNCAAILRHVIAKAGPFATFEELWQASERMRIPATTPFGKHKGAPIAKVPPDYKRWLLGQPDVDPYLVKALRGY